MRYKIASLAAAVIAFGGVQVASAADMAVKARPMAAPVPYLFNWTGFYVGINGGWAQDTIKTTAVNFVQPDTNGGAIGGHIGFNYQWTQFVFGAEFDGDWLGLKADAPCFNPAFNCHTEVNHQLSLRGRLGLAFDRFLVYGTGGVAWTTLKGNTQIIATGVTFPDSSDRTGWIAGFGAEYALWNNLIIGAEYLHADFRGKDMHYDVTYPDVKLTTDIVRARLSWLFNFH